MCSLLINSPYHKNAIFLILQAVAPIGAVADMQTLTINFVNNVAEKCTD